MGINFFDHTYEELSAMGVDFDLQRLSTDNSTAWLDYDFEYEISFPPISSINDANIFDEIDEWCTENLSGFFKVGWGSSSFEKEEDAMAFKLRWT